MLSWRSKYPITSKETLLTYLQQHKLLEIDAEVKLCYKDIMTDLEVHFPSRSRVVVADHHHASRRRRNHHHCHAHLDEPLWTPLCVALCSK
jgi:hypothetical protein